MSKSKSIRRFDPAAHIYTALSRPYLNMFSGLLIGSVIVALELSFRLLENITHSAYQFTSTPSVYLPPPFDQLIGVSVIITRVLRLKH